MSTIAVNRAPAPEPRSLSPLPPLPPLPSVSPPPPGSPSLPRSLGSSYSQSGLPSPPPLMTQEHLYEFIANADAYSDSSEADESAYSSAYTSTQSVSVDSFSYHQSNGPADSLFPDSRAWPNPAPRRRYGGHAADGLAPRARTDDARLYVNLAPTSADEGDAEARAAEMLVSSMLDREGAFGNANHPDQATLFARSLLVQDPTITEVLLGRGYGYDGLSELEQHFLLGRLVRDEVPSKQARVLINRLKDASYDNARHQLAKSCFALLDLAGEVAQKTHHAGLLKALYQADVLRNVRVLETDRVVSLTANPTQQSSGVSRVLNWLLNVFRWFLPSAVCK